MFDWLKPKARLSLALMISFAATGCGKQLVVHPAEPEPAPKVAVPQALTDPIPTPSWLQSPPRT